MPFLNLERLSDARQFLVIRIVQSNCCVVIHIGLVGKKVSLRGAGGEILLLHLHGLCFAAGGAAAAAGTSASAAALAAGAAAALAAGAAAALAAGAAALAAGAAAAGAAAGAATGAVFRPLIHCDVEVVDIFWGNKRFR